MEARICVVHERNSFVALPRAALDALLGEGLVLPVIIELRTIEARKATHKVKHAALWGLGPKDRPDFAG